MPTQVHTMPSAEELFEKHKRTINSPALKAIREWRQQGCSVPTNEEDVRKFVLKSQPEFKKFFEDTLNRIAGQK